MTTTNRNNYRQVGNGPRNQLTAHHRQVIDAVGATRTLVEGESGALCLFDKADGQIWTLPLATIDNVGMWFDFQTTVSVSGGTIKIVTGDPATEFLLGSILAYTIATASLAGFSANGTTIASVAMQTGGTYGGLIGTRLRFECIRPTQWAVSGLTVGSGSLVTPFATS